MTWALVILSCVRVCLPQYVEVYVTHTQCVQQIKTATWPQHNHSYCVPIARKE